MAIPGGAKPASTPLLANQPAPQSPQPPMKPSPKKLPLLLKKDESGGGAMTDEKSGSAAGNMI